MPTTQPGGSSLLESLPPDIFRRIRLQLRLPPFEPTLQLLFEGRDSNTFKMLSTSKDNTELIEISARHLDCYRQYEPCSWLHYESFTDYLTRALSKLSTLSQLDLPPEHRRIVLPMQEWDGWLGTQAFKVLPNGSATLLPHDSLASKDNRRITVSRLCEHPSDEAARTAVIAECMIAREEIVTGTYVQWRHWTEPCTRFEFKLLPNGEMQQEVQEIAIGEAGLTNTNRVLQTETTEWENDDDSRWAKPTLCQLLCSKDWFCMVLKPAGRNCENCQRMLARFVLKRSNPCLTASQSLRKLFHDSHSKPNKKPYKP